ncbi:MAG: hypothetical protein J6X92_06635 [Bacteroidales bacterium]|nr:hypothetical protein [Bacteroidales bacterium]
MSAEEPLLFNIDPQPKKEEPENHYFCESCKYHERWLCGSKVIHYCGKRKSGRTSNRLLKIKAGNRACGYYKMDNI